MELQQKLIRQLKANDQIIQQWSVEEMSATGVLYQQVNQKLQTITQTYNLLSTVELMNKQLEESEVIQQKAERTLNNLDLAQQQFKEIQLWEVELLFLVYYVSNYILKYFATSNADDKFQQIISSWRLFMNYSLTQEGQKYDFDRIRPQSTIQSRYLIFQKGKIEITTCNKRTAMTKINAVGDVQGRSTNSLNKLRQF
ncbi:Hypothetical_protein [Hexamita inflata]|uniref:Hypothetical_protein n=1 Tax=Hexamita inflata TaxID=28002 RepID=A0AA86Q075_9EUKA|nr:Hypothetical protein HINF_LOCUS37294 [Hexamita inflata]